MLLFYLSLIEKKEDQSKFEKLYYTYRHLMKYIALEILKDEQTAEDAVHNAFIKTINYLDKIDEINCYKTQSLIVIIIKSVSKDMYRKKKRENTVFLEDTYSEPVSDDFSLQAFSLENVVAKINELPEIYRDVMVLKYLEDFDNREIAKLLEIKESLVRKRLERAKAEFKYIEKYNYILENDTVDAAVERLRSIITAENCVMSRNYKYIKENF